MKDLIYIPVERRQARTGAVYVASEDGSLRRPGGPRVRMSKQRRRDLKRVERLCALEFQPRSARVRRRMFQLVEPAAGRE